MADESLTSCTGPISHSESDFSSFNYNSASMGAAAKGGQKYGSYLCLILFNVFLKLRGITRFVLKYHGTREQ